MLPSYGVDFGPLPFLEHIRDIEAFEGPILSELRSPSHDVFLEKWCARSEGITRRLVVRSKRRAISEYLAQRIPMLNLLVGSSGDVGFLVDRRQDFIVRTQLVQVSKLPEKYLPKSTAMHDASLRPAMDVTPQTFLLDGQWDAKLIADIEKLYMEVYSFTYFTAAPAANDDQVLPAQIPAYVFSWLYGSGWDYWRAFRHLRNAVPKPVMARTEEVAAASPGVLTIAAPTAVAERVNYALTVAATRAADDAYHTLHEWSKLASDRVDDVPASAIEDLHRVCAQLGLSLDSMLPHVLGEESDQRALLKAGKLVAAYYRRLWKILYPQQTEFEFLETSLQRPLPFDPPMYGLIEEDDEPVESLLPLPPTEKLSEA